MFYKMERGPVKYGGRTRMGEQKIDQVSKQEMVTSLQAGDVTEYTLDTRSFILEMNTLVWS